MTVLKEEGAWDEETGGYPRKIGDNIYFVKIEPTKNQPVLYFSSLAVAEQNLKAGMTYNIRLKSLSTGKAHLTAITLKNSVDKQGLAAWPLYGFLPAGSEAKMGPKVYARLEPLDMVKWFETNEEKAPWQMWRY